MSPLQRLLRWLPEPVSWRLYCWFGLDIVSTPEEEEIILEAVRKHLRDHP